eukprot:Gb_35415 [translate_table: standard]
MEDLDLSSLKFIPSFCAQERIAFSVGDPVTSTSPPPSGIKTLPVVFWATPSMRREHASEGTSSLL